MTTVEEIYEFTTVRESVLNKDWAAGSSQILDSYEYIVGPDYKAQYKKVKYPPAWLKSIDEPIVNALDHFIRMYGSDEPVTHINVDFTKDGQVSVTNNGRGIEVVVHKVATEKLKSETWVPEFIFGELFQGSNKKKDPDSIIGGTNGLGGKISNIFSTEFTVETVDGTRQLRYYQKWHSRMEHKAQPVIAPAPGVKPYTKLTFRPDYSHFGYKDLPAAIPMLTDIVRTRVIYAALYVHYTNRVSGVKQPVEVCFNGSPIPVTSTAELARILFPSDAALTTIVTPTVKPNSPYKYPWEVTVIVPSSDPTPWTSIVNGIVVKDGKHFNHLAKQLTEGIRARIAKLFSDKAIKFNASYVTNSIVLIANTKIPGANWTGQRKDVLDIHVKKLSGYVLDKKFIESVAKKLQDNIVTKIASSKPNVKLDDIELYDSNKLRPAAKAGTKYSSKCTLIATEGDGAKSQVEIGIANNPALGFDYYGVISLGGVIVNVRNECRILQTADGSQRRILSTKLAKNKFFTNFLRETGLNFDYCYDPTSPTYKKEVRELRYGCIVACVDQDYDGTGNIFSLVLNAFEYFWPHLLQAGFLKRFATPRQRAYPKRGGKVIEFYTDSEYEGWAAKTDISKYDIQYYKGLGTHSRAECIRMFTNFHNYLFSYPLDERSHELFEIYFGKDAKKRRIALIEKIKELTPEQVQRQFDTKMVPCSEHLESETLRFQQDNIERHLDHAIDGFNQSARMIFDGSSKNRDKMKVAQLAGYISATENYHHGEASLEKSITGKAFITVGGKQIPQLLPYGQFGTRLQGGKDAAPARYIHTRFNDRAMDLIFPPEDYPLLEFRFDEGKRGAPVYFVPIIPMAIIESTDTTAHGWNIVTHGRDAFKVIENVRRLIHLADDAPLLKMPPCTYGWTGEIRMIRGEPYSVGVYELRDGAVHITELPLRVWTLDYIEKLLTKKGGPVIRDIQNHSDDRKVDITVYLQEGALQWLEEHEWGDSAYTDCIEEYFGLRERMVSHLNMFGANGRVVEFKTYEDVMHYWFPYRKALYAKRIDRQIALLELKIGQIKSIIRYIKESKELNLARRAVADMELRLATADPPYDKYYVSLLDKPEFTPTEDLRRLILNGSCASYDYLLNLSDKNKSKEALASREKRLAELEGQLAELVEKASRGRFRGAEIWQDELTKLEEVIRQGRETDWVFEEKNKFYF